MIGESFGQFRIVAKIGGGGMGVVYRAIDQRLGREVAVKFLPPHLAADSIAKQRFEHEARSASALEHPRICTIHAIEDTGDGRSFLVMPLYDGETIRQRLDRGPLTIDEALSIASQVADGLAAAHDAGIVHRDVKPANLMLAPDGRVKIVDFGLAKSIELDLTQPGDALGTLDYMSPEQARGEEVDARTDVWSLGALTYEMIAGKRPFHGEGMAVVQEILGGDPPLLATTASGESVPAPLRSLVSSMLTKAREGRPATMHEVRDRLDAIIAERQATPRSARARVVVAALVVVVLVGAGFWWRSASVERHARTVLIPELERLRDAMRWEGGAREAWAALALIEQIRGVLGEDPTVDEIEKRISAPMTITSQPPGARVLVTSYDEPDGPWQQLGTTPLTDTLFGFGFSRLRLELEGYEPVEDLVWTWNVFGAPWQYDLQPVGTTPDRMVHVDGWKSSIWLPGLDHIEAEDVPDFLMDRFEVTNAEFKEFVDAGGYGRKEFWTEAFVRDGRPVSFDDAIAAFVDATGRPGPAGWEVGEPPADSADLPVGGVSWYEAAAYAKFVGKELPTIFEWNAVATTFASFVIVPQSNLVGQHPVAVGSMPARHRFGVADLAGNVREWCRNLSTMNDARYALGGGWSDQAYAFNDAYAASPWDRSETHGFRCVKPLSEAGWPERLTRTIEVPFRDFETEKPVDDATYEIFLRQFAYDRSPLEAKVEEQSEGSFSRRIRVSFDAGYGDERAAACLFLPLTGKPPYQTILYFPGSNAIHDRSSERLQVGAFDFILKSGRAVACPIFKGTYERGDELDSDYPSESSFYRDHVVMWAKDLGRTIDYLETRDDIDSSKLAYYGVSWGGALGGIMPAIERRLKVNLLYVAGMLFQRAQPEVDQINFVPRVLQPTLMINGELDFFFPVETAQRPMFELLGTPPADKRWQVHPGAHSVPRTVLAREMLAWLDRYLGPLD